jgi:plastocyanin
MRRRLLAAVAVMTVSGVAAVPALAVTRTIKVGDNYFIKKTNGTVTVKKGTTVKWLWTGKHPHTVVGSGAGRFINSGKPKKTGSYTVITRKRGTFRIICTIHNGQRMTLKVT